MHQASTFRKNKKERRRKKQQFVPPLESLKPDTLLELTSCSPLKPLEDVDLNVRSEDSEEVGKMSTLRSQTDDNVEEALSPECSNVIARNINIRRTSERLKGSRSLVPEEYTSSDDESESSGNDSDFFPEVEDTVVHTTDANLNKKHVNQATKALRYEDFCDGGKAFREAYKNITENSLQERLKYLDIVENTSLNKSNGQEENPITYVTRGSKIDFSFEEILFLRERRYTKRLPRNFKIMRRILTYQMFKKRKVEGLS